MCVSVCVYVCAFVYVLVYVCVSVIVYVYTFYQCINVCKTANAYLFLTKDFWYKRRWYSFEKEKMDVLTDLKCK